MRFVVVLLLCLLLTACGGDPQDEPSAAVTASNGDVYNADDVAFATEMIQHHALAVRMVVIAQDRPLEPAMRELLDGIRETQVSEVEVMVDWLTAWGEKIPETSLDHSSAHDGSGDTDELHALEEASDAEFPDLWLQRMIEHHEQSIELAEAEQDVGRFKPALTLARNIVRTQGAEIASMNELAGAHR